MSHDINYESHYGLTSAIADALVALYAGSETSLETLQVSAEAHLHAVGADEDYRVRVSVLLSIQAGDILSERLYPFDIGRVTYKVEVFERSAVDRLGGLAG